MTKLIKIINWIQYYLPYCYRVKRKDGIFQIMKPILITPKFLEIGKGVFIRNGARIEGVDTYLSKRFNPKIIIKDFVSIEQNLHLTCANEILIGFETAIAANVSITDIHHPYTDIHLSPENQNIIVSNVKIGNRCKIYNNVVILPGVELGNHTVVGANSVVQKGIYPDFSVIVGSPAKIVKKYCPQKNDWIRID